MIEGQRKPSSGSEFCGKKSNAKTNKHSVAEFRAVDGEEPRLRKAETQEEERASLRDTRSPEEQDGGAGLDGGFTCGQVLKQGPAGDGIFRL